MSIRRLRPRREGMLYVHAANGRYSAKRRDLEAEGQPFWEYWEGTAAA